ncbi:purple acid phosphatase family protein [Anditalea andensis]|uniref:Metallophosphoesterase n=1 Tax=Anditalea andensis TaxID=1048983 RepID=A0A074L068_9BACT|nr:metallophosphoesterase family protein [Anditalea andensis]KEO75601.1 hypothetical protein EL17_00470 [Anditalea andensis]
MTRWQVWVLILVFKIPGYGAFSQEYEKNLPPENAQIRYRASEIPDRILLTISSADAKQTTVTWRVGSPSDKGSNKGLLEISPKGKTVTFYKNPVRLQAISSDFTTFMKERVIYHKVILKDLIEDQPYVYRVGNGKIWSEWFDLAPIKAKEKNTFKFIYLGDAQNDLYPLFSRVIRSANQRAPDAAFYLHAGDLINHSQNDYEWAEWFAAGSWVLSTVPQMAIPGNHEYVKNEEGDKSGISPYWDAQFNYPENSPEGMNDRAYYFDYEHARIICLDSNVDLELQADWLRKVLEDSRQEWHIVLFHHPVISGAEGRMNEGVLKTWKPILDEYKVDMVLQGHDHIYGRGNNVSSGLGLWDEHSGTVYVVSVAGRKMYTISDHPWMDKKAANLQTYQVISIDKDQLFYKAYSLDGSLFDAFTLIKQKGSINQLVEQEIEKP